MNFVLLAYMILQTLYYLSVKFEALNPSLSTRARRQNTLTISGFFQINFATYTEFIARKYLTVRNCT